jgi:hypothetical protein
MKGRWPCVNVRCARFVCFARFKGEEGPPPNPDALCSPQLLPTACKAPFPGRPVDPACEVLAEADARSFFLSDPPHSHFPPFLLAHVPRSKARWARVATTRHTATRGSTAQSGLKNIHAHPW